MEKDTTCPTIQAVIHQGEGVTPLVTAVSGSIGISHPESVVTDSKSPKGGH